MNPYSMTNPLRSTFKPAPHASDAGSPDRGLDFSLSRATYRLVSFVEPLIRRKS